MTSCHLWPSSSQLHQAFLNEITGLGLHSYMQILYTRRWPWASDELVSSTADHWTVLFPLQVDLHRSTWTVEMFYYLCCMICCPNVLAVCSLGTPPTQHDYKGKYLVTAYYSPPLQDVRTYPINVNRSRLLHPVAASFCCSFFEHFAFHSPRLDVWTAPPRFLKCSTQRASPLVFSLDGCSIHVYERRCKMFSFVCFCNLQISHTGRSPSYDFWLSGDLQEEMNLVM